MAAWHTTQGPPTGRWFFLICHYTAGFSVEILAEVKIGQYFCKTHTYEETSRRLQCKDVLAYRKDTMYPQRNNGNQNTSKVMKYANVKYSCS